MDRKRPRSSCSCGSCRRTAAYLVFAGLEQAIGDLLAWRFSAEQVEDMRRLPAFAGRRSGVLRRTCRRSGSRATSGRCPRGRSSFPGETAAAGEAAVAPGAVGRDFLLASLAYPTLVASKAARMVERAGGTAALRLRRAARARAARRPARGPCRVPRRVSPGRATSRPRVGWASLPSGTMAHSWVQSFDTEAEAFAAFARVFPGSTTLLVDTYDTLEGVRQAAAIEPPVQAIRLDSGDLVRLARAARAILDAHGRTARQDRRLRRPRRVPDRDAGRRRCAHRRLRRRDRADHQPRCPRAVDGLQARRARRQGPDQAQPRQEDLPDGQAGLSPAATSRAGSAATTSRGPTSRPTASRCWSRSSDAASSSRRLPALEAIRARCRDQLAVAARSPPESDRDARLSDHLQRPARSRRPARSMGRSAMAGRDLGRRISSLPAIYEPARLRRAPTIRSPAVALYRPEVAGDGRRLAVHPAGCRARLTIREAHGGSDDGQDHQRGQPEGRGGQDDHRDQPRRRAGQGGPDGAGHRRRSPVQRDQRARGRARAAASAGRRASRWPSRSSRRRSPSCSSCRARRAWPTPTRSRPRTASGPRRSASSSTAS